MYLGKDYKPKNSNEDFGWHSRKLPHLDSNVHTQFVTFRLSDSMPQELIDQWREESRSDATFRKKVEAYLDAGFGNCWLRMPKIAEIVASAIKHFDGKRYKLHAWIVMPNHVHILFTQYENEHLPEIMHSIKSYTAQMANRSLGLKGQFWQHESFDRYIRDGRHFKAVVKYIEMNPVKARLCELPEECRFGSAFVE